MRNGSLDDRYRIEVAARPVGLVTGFLEFEEHSDAAVRREVGEELGLVVETSKLAGVYPFAQMNQVLIAYHLNASGEVAIDRAELADFKCAPR